MGVSAWLRAFTSPLNLITFLPQAAIWTNLMSGNMAAADDFVFVTKYWAQIVGWMTSLATLGFSTFFTTTLSLFGGEYEQEIQQFANIFIAVTVAEYVFEITSWVLFYVSYGDALKYAELLEAAASMWDEVLGLVENRDAKWNYATTDLDAGLTTYELMDRLNGGILRLAKAAATFHDSVTLYKQEDRVATFGFTLVSHIV